MFKNRILRKILGPKRDAVTVNWRRLRNVELYDLYSSPNIISSLMFNGPCIILIVNKERPN